MNEQQTFQKITQATIEEHRQIEFYLDQVSVTLDGLDATGTDVEPMRRLAAQIDGLKERLIEHHQSEEEGGLFQDDLPATDPDDVRPELLEVGVFEEELPRHSGSVPRSRSLNVATSR